MNVRLCPFWCSNRLQVLLKENLQTRALEELSMVEGYINKHQEHVSPYSLFLLHQCMRQRDRSSYHFRCSCCINASSSMFLLHQCIIFNFLAASMHQCRQ